MTKKLRLFLMCTFALLFGSVSAQTEVVIFKVNEGNSSETVFEKDGVKLSIDQNKSTTAPGGYLNRTDQFRIYKDAILNVSTTKGNIVKIELTSSANAGSKYGPDLLSVTDGTYSCSGKVGTWEGSAPAVAFLATAQSRATQIIVTVAPADENYVAAPSIEGKATFLESNEVTITAGEDAAIYYTLDGTEPTAASTSYQGAITLNETTTVKAIAVEGNKSSEVVEATFTKVVPDELTFAEFSQLTVANKERVKVSLDGVVVAYVDGSTVHLREGNNAAAFYNIGRTFTQGDVLEGYIVADFQLYNSLPELKPNNDLTDVNTIEVKETAEVAPYKVTVAELNQGQWMAHYLVLSEVTIETETVDSKTTTYIVQGEDKIACYKGIDLTSCVDTGKTYDVEVLFNSVYKGTPQVKPLSIEETTTTAIEAITTNASNKVYTLDGRRVMQPVKGINIINGKKVVVK